MQVKIDPLKCKLELGDIIEINGAHWVLAEKQGEGWWTLRYDRETQPFKRN